MYINIYKEAGFMFIMDNENKEGITSINISVNTRKKLKIRAAELGMDYDGLLNYLLEEELKYAKVF